MFKALVAVAVVDEYLTFVLGDDTFKTLYPIRENSVITGITVAMEPPAPPIMAATLTPEVNGVAGTPIPVIGPEELRDDLAIPAPVDESVRLLLNCNAPAATTSFSVFLEVTSPA